MTHSDNVRDWSNTSTSPSLPKTTSRSPSTMSLAASPPLLWTKKAFVPWEHILFIFIISDEKFAAKHGFQVLAECSAGCRKKRRICPSGRMFERGEKGFCVPPATGMKEPVMEEKEQHRVTLFFPSFLQPWSQGAQAGGGDRRPARGSFKCGGGEVER